MPTGSSSADNAVDTSVAVPLVISDHDDHERVFSAVGDRSLAIAGHAAFETYSILTRMPPPVRLAPSAASRVVMENFDTNCFLSPQVTHELLRGLHSLDIAGGSVYDGLVGAAAREHGLTLMTRDRRAIPTYQALDVDYELVD